MSTVRLKGQRLIEIRNALSSLAQRRLPPISDVRVALLLTALREPCEAYLDVVKKLQRRQSEAAEMEEGSEDRKQEERSILDDLQELEEQRWEVKLPKRRLTETDLPVAFKARDNAGEANSEGRAWIASTLQPEFFVMTDPDEQENADAE